MTNGMSVPMGRHEIRNQVLWLPLLFTLMALALASCAKVQQAATAPMAILPSPTPTRQPAPQDWHFRWLKGVPCRAPCWEGITPGKTTASEAIEILKESPLVTNVQKKSYPRTPEAGSVSWDWVNGETGGSAYYPINSPTQTINSIFPTFREQYALHDVLQTYGEPSHIIAQAEGHGIGSKIFYDTWFVYLPYGLALRGGGATKPDLEKMYFDQVIFFTPTREGLEASVWFAKQYPEWVIPWQGFKGFDYYCRDRSGGIECREQ